MGPEQEAWGNEQLLSLGWLYISIASPSADALSGIDCKTLVTRRTNARIIYSSLRIFLRWYTMRGFHALTGALSLPLLLCMRSLLTVAIAQRDVQLCDSICLSLWNSANTASTHEDSARWVKIHSSYQLHRVVISICEHIVNTALSITPAQAERRQRSFSKRWKAVYYLCECCNLLSWYDARAFPVLMDHAMANYRFCDLNFSLIVQHTTARPSKYWPWIQRSLPLMKWNESPNDFTAFLYLWDYNRSLAAPLMTDYLEQVTNPSDIVWMLRTVYNWVTTLEALADVDTYIFNDSTPGASIATPAQPLLTPTHSSSNELLSTQPRLFKAALAAYENYVACATEHINASEE